MVYERILYKNYIVLQMTESTFNSIGNSYILNSLWVQ
jgi:hypothetical protein